MRHFARTPLLLLLAAFTAAACRGPAGPATDLASYHRFRATLKPVISSPVVGDVTGDGDLAIAVGSWDGYFYLVDTELNDLSGWPKYSRDGFFASAALVDLDDDGALEIVVGAESGQLYAWHHDGSDVPGFPVDLGYQIWASPTVLEGPRIAMGSHQEMVLIDGQGLVTARWPMQGWPVASAATDGPYLALTTLTPGNPSLGWGYVWTVDGAVLDGYPVELPMDSDSSPAIADLDGDGQPWFIFGDDAGWLHVLDRAGQQREGFPVRTEGPEPGQPTPTPHPPGGNVHSIEASPAVADLTGDGRWEIVVGSWDGQLYVWDDKGQPLPGWPVGVDDHIIASAALVDVTGDGALDIIVGCKDGYLYGWTAGAEPLPGFPKDLGAPVFSSAWVGDLNGNGKADIVVGANNGIHLLRDVGTIGRAGWPMFGADIGRSGRATGGH